MPRWFSGTVAVIFYLEMAAIVCGIKLPQPKEPSFQKKTDPIPWVKGPYDNDWDHCWVHLRTGAVWCEPKDS